VSLEVNLADDQEYLISKFCDNMVAAQFLGIGLPRNFLIISGQTNFKSAWANKSRRFVCPGTDTLMTIE
jgi:hypothetical protein